MASRSESFDGKWCSSPPLLTPANFATASSVRWPAPVSRTARSAASSSRSRGGWLGMGLRKYIGRGLYRPDGLAALPKKIERLSRPGCADVRGADPRQAGYQGVALYQHVCRWLLQWREICRTHVGRVDLLYRLVGLL